MMESTHKTTIGASQLYPVYVQEVMPGDTFNVQAGVFCRLATPLFPILDNLQMEFFFFFVPNRLVWVHWPNFMGEQNSPADSITYSVPQIVSPVSGFARNSIYDYFGLPTVGQTGAGNQISVSALPFRGYNLIYQEWFRDQNLNNAMKTGTAGSLAAGAKWMCQSDDGPDPSANYSLFPVNKRHDYFTAALPWTQKGGVAVTLPLGTVAPVKTAGGALVTGTQLGMTINLASTGGAPATPAFLANNSQTTGVNTVPAPTGAFSAIYPSNLYADLSAATASTINSIRLAFQTQRLLEKDARGGTRYVESILQHFGVRSPDYRLMRPEYLGGGKIPVNFAPVPQTAQTGLTGGSSPLGTISAAGMAQGRVGYKGSFTEHGHVIGLACVRNDKIYQNGIRRFWKRLTRYDYYYPVFAHLGEQSIFNYEIYSDGSANDALTFGYIPRWDEYRYNPSITSSYFRSTAATPLDAWHLAQNFTSLPALNGIFMNDDLRATLQRNLAAGAAANGQQLLCDFFFKEIAARPLPMNGVPGLVDHF